MAKTASEVLKFMSDLCGYGFTKTTTKGNYDCFTNVYYKHIHLNIDNKYRRFGFYVGHECQVRKLSDGIYESFAQCEKRLEELRKTYLYGKQRRMTDLKSQYNSFRALNLFQVFQIGFFDHCKAKVYGYEMKYGDYTVSWYYGEVRFAQVPIFNKHGAIAKPDVFAFLENQTPKIGKYSFNYDLIAEIEAELEPGNRVDPKFLEWSKLNFTLDKQDGHSLNDLLVLNEVNKAHELFA